MGARGLSPWATRELLSVSFDVFMCFIFSSEPDKRKRSPTESISTPVGKDPGLAGRGDPKAMAQLRVPQLGPQAPSAPGRSPKELDTRSLKEENFVASIGVYHVLSELKEFWLLQCPCLFSIHPESRLSLPHALLSRQGDRFVSISSHVSLYFSIPYALFTATLT